MILIISDLQRETSEVYPLEFYDILEELKVKSIEEISTLYDDESKEIFSQYLNLLLDKEYGFITENDWDKSFPPISYEYNNPSFINDLFFELKNNFTALQLKSTLSVTLNSIK